MALLVAWVLVCATHSTLAATITTTYVTAESYVQGGTNASTNYGAGDLIVKGDTFSGVEYARKAYLTIDVSSLASMAGALEAVELVLTGGNHTAFGSRVHAVYGIIDNADWNVATLPETGAGAINWANAPKNNTASAIGFVGQGTTPSSASRFLDSVHVNGADPLGTEYRFDVSDYVKWALGAQPTYSSFAASDADQNLTFMVAWTTTTSGGNGYRFDSKEFNFPARARLESTVPVPAGIWLGFGLLATVGVARTLRRRIGHHRN